MIIVLMGVSGAGKTTIGRLLAAGLGWPFLEGDEFHSPANVDKMRRGVPLDDADRGPWLDAIRDALAARIARGESAVLACSALKESYRERLRVGDEVRFVYLKIDPALARSRLEERKGHYFAPELLASQFEALEEPSGVTTVDVGDSPKAAVRRIRSIIGQPRVRRSP